MNSFANDSFHDLRLCVFTSMLLYDDGRTLTTDGTFQLMLPAFAGKVASLDLCAAVRRTRSKHGREQVPLERAHIVSLPGFRNGKDLYLLRFPRFLLATWRIYRQVGSRWDVVWIVDCEPLQQVLFWLCRLRGKPAVVYLRTVEDRVYSERKRPPPLSWMVRGFERFQWFMLPRVARSAYLMVTGQELAERFSAIARRGHTFTSTLLRQQDIEPWLPEHRRAARGETVALLTVGRLAPVKGLEVLLRALALLRRQHPELSLRLRCVGHNAVPDYVARLETMVESLGLREMVTFVPAMQAGDQLWDEYRSADIFLLPSLVEGTPKTVPEALARGLPIVASAVGGIPAMVRDGEEAILVPPGDVEALAGAIARLARDEQLRLALGRKGVARAANYLLDHEADRALAFMRDACRASSPRRKVTEA